MPQAAAVFPLASSYGLVSVPVSVPVMPRPISYGRFRTLTNYLIYMEFRQTAQTYDVAIVKSMRNDLDGVAPSVNLPVVARGHRFYVWFRDPNTKQDI